MADDNEDGRRRTGSNASMDSGGVVSAIRQSVWVFVRHERALWGVTIFFFGICDLVTTGLGIRLVHIDEAGPIGRLAIAQFGFPGIVGMKLVVLLLCYTLWRLIPDPDRVGILLGLSSVGVLVTVWNSVLLLSAYY